VVDVAVAAVVPALLEKGRSDCGCTSPRCCWRIALWWYERDHMPYRGGLDPWMTLLVNRRSWSRVIHAIVLIRSRKLMWMIGSLFVAGIHMNAMIPVAGAFGV
jgi:hypothetical protein